MRKNEIDWETRFTKSIAMEYLPPSVSTTVERFFEPLSPIGKRFKTPTGSKEPDTGAILCKKSLSEQRKVELDGKLAEMNEKVKFYEDIIEMEELEDVPLPRQLHQKGKTDIGGPKYLYEWDFCSIHLSKVEKVKVVKDMFTEMGWFNKFDIKEETFIHFMWELAYFYSRNNNSFHNFSHSIQVAHSAFYLLGQYTKFSNLFNESQKLAFLISCLGHDLDHRGKTNHFEIAAKSEIALTYYDAINPLERHHAAVLFKILAKKSTNIMKSIAEADWTPLKKEMIENILATDMQGHFTMLSKFKQQLLSNPYFGAQLPCSHEDRQLISNHFIHLVDLSGTYKNFEVANTWSRLLRIEFTTQYNLQLEMGLPPTPHLKDLDKENRYLASELSFLEVIVEPLFDLCNNFMEEEMREERKCLMGNIEQYKKLIEEEKQKEQVNQENSLN